VLLLQRHCLPAIAETDAVLSKCIGILQLYESSSRTALRCLRLLELSLKTFPSRVAGPDCNNIIGGDANGLLQRQSTARNVAADPAAATASQMPPVSSVATNSVEDLILHSQSFQNGLQQSFMSGPVYLGNQHPLNDASTRFDEELLDLDLAWLNAAPFDLMSPDLYQDFPSALAFG
jgi:hypothetical protein